VTDDEKTELKELWQKVLPKVDLMRMMNGDLWFVDATPPLAFPLPGEEVPMTIEMRRAVFWARYYGRPAKYKVFGTFDMRDAEGTFVDWIN
jgi:hypothetical protein